MHTVTGRLFTALFLIALLSGGCGDQNGTPEVALPADFSSCSEPRPQACTFDYQPVCGLRDDGSWHTYGNACTACGDAQVKGHRPGECHPAADT